MIIRIMGDGQYRADSCLLDDLNTIDNKIVEHVSKGDHKKFRKDLSQMISTIKEKGEPLDPVEILPSDLIVPPEDMTLEEARRVFSGHGLIED